MRVYSPSPEFTPLAEVTNYTRLQIIRRFVGRSVVQIDFPAEAEAVSYMQKNCWIVADDEPYIIRTITQTEKTVTVYGFGGHFGLEGRITIPPAGMYAISKTGSTDCVVKEFILKSTATANRSLNIICADVQGDDIISDQSRLKNLGDEVARVLIGAGRGERFCIENGAILFDTYAGTDRSASCVFDLKYKNIKDFTYTLDATKTQSTPIVGGAGEGTEREIYITGEDAAGWDRREVFIDARDVDAGDTDTLTQRALQALIADDQQVKADVASSANLVFGVDYFLGDIVTVNIRVKTYAAAGAYFNPAVVTIPLAVRITEDTETIDNGTRTVDLTFGSTILQSDAVQTRSAISQLQSTEGASGSNIETLVSAVKHAMYRVGDVIITENPDNPAAEYGGTWIPYGSGRVPVGFTEGDPDFGTIGATPGEKAVILGTDGMPIHTHVQDAHNHTQQSHNHTQQSHNHTQQSHNHGQDPHWHKLYWPSGDRYISLSGSNGGGVARSGYQTGYSSGTVYDESLIAMNATASNQAATATNDAATAINNAATAVNIAATAVNQSAGGGGAHNNIQPSIVVYMWKRTT
jgi:microcystin-dependent protein